MSPQRQQTEAPTQRGGVQVGHLEAPGPEIMAPHLVIQNENNEAIPITCHSPFWAQLVGISLV